MWESDDLKIKLIPKKTLMITVKYFANLRSIAGKEEDQFDMGSETTLINLSHEISKTLPKIGEMILGKKVMVSINLDVAALESIIRDGDEIALLPPFSGGIWKENKMSTALESNIRIQQENFVVTDEIEAIKKGRSYGIIQWIKLEMDNGLKSQSDS